jgi:hypothetical protein
VQVDEVAAGFVIVRGKERDVFFSFFVDHDSASWTKYSPGARIYQDRAKAGSDLQELRRRARERRSNGTRR